VIHRNDNNTSAFHIDWSRMAGSLPAALTAVLKMNL
jgi:hypothetical protein